MYVHIFDLLLALFQAITAVALVETAYNLSEGRVELVLISSFFFC